MAHFAELDNNNKVLRVIVISNDETHDENGVEHESLGIAFCQKLFGENTIWVQTSINNSIRHRYAYVNGYYDKQLNAFIEPQPFASWKLNKSDLTWQPPVPMPAGVNSIWKEEKLAWEVVATKEVE